MNTLKSLAFVATICGTIAAMMWLGRNHEPLPSAADQRTRDAYRQLLGVSETLDSTPPGLNGRFVASQQPRLGLRRL